MATLLTTQNAILHDKLRGTGRKITAAEARRRYGIKNIRARMTELRYAGLRVNTEKTKSGKTAYSISARDVNGSSKSLTTSTR